MGCPSALTGRAAIAFTSEKPLLAGEEVEEVRRDEVCEDADLFKAEVAPRGVEGTKRPAWVTDREVIAGCVPSVRVLDKALDFGGKNWVLKDLAPRMPD